MHGGGGGGGGSGARVPRARARAIGEWGVMVGRRPVCRALIRSRPTRHTRSLACPTPRPLAPRAHRAASATLGRAFRPSTPPSSLLGSRGRWPSGVVSPTGGYHARRARAWLRTESGAPTVPFPPAAARPLTTCTPPVVSSPPVVPSTCPDHHPARRPSRATANSSRPPPLLAPLSQPLPLSPDSTINAHNATHLSMTWFDDATNTAQHSHTIVRNFPRGY